MNHTLLACLTRYNQGPLYSLKIMVLMLIYIYVQLFGSKQKSEDKMKGIYMYGSVGKVVPDPLVVAFILPTSSLFLLCPKSLRHQVLERQC